MKKNEDSSNSRNLYKQSPPTMPMVKCFNGYDCSPDTCEYYLKELNDCGFAVLGINKVARSPFKRVTPQSKPTATKQNWKPGEYVSFKGTVKRGYSLKKGFRMDGTEWTLRRITVATDSGDVDLALWEDFAQMEISEGENITVENALVKDPYKGRIQISTVKNTKIYI